MNFHLYRPKTITYREFLGNHAYAEYNVKETTDIVSFYFKVIDMNDSTKIYYDNTVNINKRDYAGGIYTITLDFRDRDNPSLMLIPHLTKRNSGIGRYMTDNNINNLIRFYITDDMQDLYVYFYYYNQNETEIAGAAIIDIEPDKYYSANHAFVSNCPELQKKMPYWNAKVDLQNKVVAFNSISYLEDQVDILYKIIQLLVEKTDIDISEYQDILNSIETNNVVNLKSISVIKKDIDEDKANVRKAQKEYYEQIHKLNSETTSN